MCSMAKCLTGKSLAFKSAKCKRIRVPVRVYWAMAARYKVTVETFLFNKLDFSHRSSRAYAIANAIEANHVNHSTAEI